MADLDDIHDKLDNNEKAILSGRSWVSSALYCVFVILLIESVIPWLWYSKIRYSVVYSVSEDDVEIEKKPHDCNFLASPIGSKYCYYHVEVEDIRVNWNAQGQEIISKDGGKTWFLTDSNNPVAKPTHRVYVSWVRKDD